MNHWPNHTQIASWAQVHQTDELWVLCYAYRFGHLPQDVYELSTSGVVADPTISYPPPGVTLTPEHPIGNPSPAFDLSGIQSVAGPVWAWAQDNPIAIAVGAGLGYLALRGKDRRRYFGL